MGTLDCRYCQETTSGDCGRHGATVLPVDLGVKHLPSVSAEDVLGVVKRRADGKAVVSFPVEDKNTRIEITDQNEAVVGSMLKLTDHNDRRLIASRSANLLRLSQPDGPVELSATQVGKVLEFIVDMFFPRGE